MLLVALVPAPLWALQLAPAATRLNELVALAGWGLALAVSTGGLREPLRASASLVTALLIYGLAAIATQRFLHTSTPLMACTVGIIVATAAVALLGASHGANPRARNGLVVASAFAGIGLANALIAMLQVFCPELPDTAFYAQSVLPGRAVGNLRQPNQLSTFTLWSAVWLVPLVAAHGRRVRILLMGLFALLIFTIQLSGSRTGMLGVAVLALWGLFDHRLPRDVRAMLMAALVIYALSWWGTAAWASHYQQFIGAETRLHESSDISSSRFPVWRQTLSLIWDNPTVGVGVNEFNFAWTLSPFADRTPTFFDHSHNLVLQLFVELGIPLGLLMVALLAVALWQGFRRAWAIETPQGICFRAAFIMVLIAAIHSQLEYPLWLVYLLLPTAWAWGYCLGAGHRDDHAAQAVPRRISLGFRWGGLLILLGALWAVQQYRTVSRIYEPGSDSRSLAARAADGTKSLFYSNHADYAAATAVAHPSTQWRAFATAPHHLLDARLMLAWSIAFAERGDLDRARYLAERLREFRIPEAAGFFLPCEQARQPGEPEPFQCSKPSRAVDWREFRDPRLWEPEHR